MKLLLVKINLSLKAIIKVQSNWRYLLLSIFIALIFINILYWLLNISLFWLFLTTSILTPIEKLDIFANTLISYLNSIPLWQAIAVILLSIIQGIVISTLIYIVRSKNKLDKKALSGTTLAGFIAMLGVGCVSCGTSLVAPIISIFVSGATASVSESIHKVAVLIGLIIALYALYAVGLSAANIQAKFKAPKS